MTSDLWRALRYCLSSCLFDTDRYPAVRGHVTATMMSMFNVLRRDIRRVVALLCLVAFSSLSFESFVHESDGDQPVEVAMADTGADPGQHPVKSVLHVCHACVSVALPLLLSTIGSRHDQRSAPAVGTFLAIASRTLFVELPPPKAAI
jgi:hypothetical protein